MNKLIRNIALNLLKATMIKVPDDAEYIFQIPEATENELYVFSKAMQNLNRNHRIFLSNKPIKILKKWKDQKCRK